MVYNSTIPTTFISGRHWSGTDLITNSANAYVVRMESGVTGSNDKILISSIVHCVH